MWCLEQGRERQDSWVLVIDLLPTCVGKPFSCSVPQFPLLYNEDDTMYLPRGGMWDLVPKPLVKHFASFHASWLDLSVQHASWLLFSSLMGWLGTRSRIPPRGQGKRKVGSGPDPL